jgi:hypothetical protein
MHGLGRWLFAVTVLSLALAAGASTLTVTECFEASDFIANAALARENGITREAFLDRLEEDFMVIQAFPPALRWFAKDHDDEAFLLAAARSVFDAPLAPEAHRANFLAACFARSTA